MSVCRLSPMASSPVFRLWCSRCDCGGMLEYVW
jgi:hypothetical protein